MKLFKRWAKPSPKKELEKTTVRDEPDHRSDPPKMLRAEARFRTPRQLERLPKPLTVRYFGGAFKDLKELWSKGLAELQINGYDEYETFIEAFVRASRSTDAAWVRNRSDRYVLVEGNSYEVWPLIHRSSKSMPETVIRHRVTASFHDVERMDESDQLGGIEFVYVNDKGNGPRKHLHRAWILGVDDTGFDVIEARGRRRYLYSKVRTAGVISSNYGNLDETLVTVNFGEPSSVAVIETVTTTKIISGVTAGLKRWANSRELEVKD